MATSPAADTEAGVLGTIKRRWRGWLRAIHRDLGYLAVGLTVIYALSGLAINHVGQWDPNFTSYERTRTIAPIPASSTDDEALAQARAALSLGRPRSFYRAGDELRLEYDDRQVVILGDSGQVIDQGRKSRFFLRVANWLHYNRGKKAWTYVADAYAVLLLYLAVSGLFMIKGKKGLRWRGSALVTAGIAVPVAYVVWSGGPSAAIGRDPAAAEAPASGAPPAPVDEAEPDDDFPRMQPRTPAAAGQGQPSPGQDDVPRMQPRTPAPSDGAPPR